MPLRDHFGEGRRRNWDRIHGQWPAEIVRHLNTLLLPEGFESAPSVHLGSMYEVDIGTFENGGANPPRFRAEGGVAVFEADAPTLTIEADLSDMDEYEVRIYDAEAGQELVAVIELISPANKDRPETRDKFVTKCAALLQQGICVSIVDLVTTRKANLYAEILTRIGRSDPKLGEIPPHLYAVTLKSRMPPKGRELLDVWFYPMVIDQLLPTLPIWLRYDVSIKLPLETSYEETCRVLRIR